MIKVNVETGGAHTLVTVDGKSAEFGPVPPPTDGQGNAPIAPNGDPSVPPMGGKPNVVGDLKDGYGPRQEPMVNANQQIGLTFTVRDTGDQGRPVIARELSWQGAPGGWWTRTSWGIYDSGGTKALGADNVAPGGTLGYKIETPELMKLGPGTYTLGIAVNGPGNTVPGKLQVNWNQQP